MSRDYLGEMRQIIDAETAEGGYSSPVVAKQIVAKLRATDADYPHLPRPSLPGPTPTSQHHPKPSARRPLPPKRGVTTQLPHFAGAASASGESDRSTSPGAGRTAGRDFARLSRPAPKP